MANEFIIKKGFISKADSVITGSLTVSGSDSIVNLQEIQFDTEHSASGHTTGRMYWSDDTKTVNLEMQGSDVVLQLGQEEHVYVQNTSGVTINNGDAVRINGAAGSNVTVTKAISSIKSFKDTVEQDEILGIATEQIANNQFGYITTFGAVRGLNTSTFLSGDILYLSNTTSGSYSNIRPPAPYFEARVGVVEVSNATEGVILARPSEPIFLTDISQITSSGVITNEKTYLCYDDSTDLLNFTNEFSGSFSGSFQGDGSQLTNLQRPISSSVSTNITASNLNAGYYFRAGGNVTCSIQSSSLVSCNVGSEFEFFQTSSAGNLLFLTGSGVTLNSKSGNITLTGQFSAATLKKVDNDEWDLIGDLS